MTMLIPCLKPRSPHISSNVEIYEIADFGLVLTYKKSNFIVELLKTCIRRFWAASNRISNEKWLKNGKH